MALKVTVIDIDSQNDFTNKQGSLFVPGADENSKRAAGLIRRLRPKITKIIRSLDSHDTIDISHKAWYVDQNGNHPETDVMKGLTVITPEDFENYKWNTSLLGRRARTLKYLKALKTNGRYPHVIWPDHCLIGSWGHNMNEDVFTEILEWEREHKIWSDSVTKGSNPWTEHFSAIRAEVPDDDDLSTQVNDKLVAAIENSDVTIWIGEALSHCLANTFRDAIAAFTNSDKIKNMILARDCTSNVPTFEHLGDAFIKDMQALGMQVKNAADILA
jgi:nicotinamidase-related amidase